MALIPLTPSSGSPAAIYVNDFNMTKVTPYADPSLPTANADVIYSGPSAFLGDQQSVVVDELPAAILAASAPATANLIQVTVSGVATLLNSNNILSVVSDGGTGSKIQYREFGVVSYVFASQAPAAIAMLF